MFVLHWRHVGLLLTAGWCGAGCGATGLDWVGEPETASGWRSSDHSSLASTPLPSGVERHSATAPTDTDSAEASHPRLNRTVTLGELDVPAPTLQGAQSPAPFSIVINNYSQGGVAGPGYGGYGSFGYVYSGSASRVSATGASRSSVSALQPGQDWPAVADHGSSFPYRSAPASPWARGK